MKKILCTLMLAVASILTIPSHAQNPVFTSVGPESCGPLTSTLDCNFIPVVANGENTKVLFEPFYNPSQYNPGYNVVAFYDNVSNLGIAHVTKVEENGVNVSGTKSTSGIVLAPKTLGANSSESTVTVFLTGTTTDNVPYTGIVLLNVHTTYAYHSGRYASYFWTWTVDNGIIDISYAVPAQSKNEPITKAVKTDTSLSWTIHPSKLHAYIPPGCIAAPVDVTPVTPPYSCSLSQIPETCQVFKGLCQTSSEYQWYSEVYWTSSWYYDY